MNSVAATREVDVEDCQALALHECISALMREFRIEPGLLAGSVYSDLHSNDIGLFEILAGPGKWNVRGIAERLAAPITTISSALDRLEGKRLIVRKRDPDDRRAVQVVLTARGKQLQRRLENAHIQNCRLMLQRLAPADRLGFLRLAARLTGK